MEEFLAIREVHAKLEGHAAAPAARRLWVDDSKALEDACIACDAHVIAHGNAKPDANYQHNLLLHKTVGIAAHNPVLLDMIKTNARKLIAYDRARYRYKDSIPKSAAGHRNLATLILDRDSVGAEVMMVDHVMFDSITALDLIAVLSRNVG